MKRNLVHLFTDLIKRLSKVLDGTVGFGRWKVPKPVAVGVAAVMLLYLGVAGIYSVATPLNVSGDTRQHADYVWQLYNGELPVRAEGLKYQPVVELYGNFKLQSASANPPFFYILQAPFMGPLLNEYKYEAAVLVGRMVNLAFGLLAIVALAWAGWVFGGNRRKEVFAVAVPALSVLTYRFVRLNLDFALDALLVALCTIGIVLTYKILQHGLVPRYLIPLAILSVVGLATKAPYIVVLGISLLGVVVAALVHGSRSLLKNFAKGAVVAGAILLLVAAAIGWFYYLYNFSVYGNWVSAREPGYTGGRVVKSFTDVITSPGLWALFYGDLVKNVGLSIAITVMAIGGFLLLPAQKVKKFVKSKQTRFVLPLLSLLLLGIFATQLEHAVGVGAINFRYMLPAIVVFGLFLSFGLLAFKRTRGQLVAIAAIAMGVSSIQLKEGVGIMGPTAENGIPVLVIYILLGLFAVGAALLVAAMFKLTAGNKPANAKP